MRSSLRNWPSLRRRSSSSRLAFSGLTVLACWFSLAAKPTSAASVNWPEMVFYVAKGSPNACGRGCQQWIAADGAIDADAAPHLRQLLSKLGGHKLPIFFNSPGGQTAGAIELGRLLRQEKLVAGVSRTTPVGCDRDQLYDQSCTPLKHDGVTADLEDAAAMCHSACVYVLAGAFIRLIPPGARLGIHAAVIRPRSPLPADLLAAAKAQADRRIDEYLREMGMNHALFVAANATPHQSLRFLRRDELIRFGLDRREFGETVWHYSERPQPAVSKAYFIHTAPSRLSYRTAFLRMNCGDAGSLRLTLGIEMAPDEAAADARPFMVTMNGARADEGWSRPFAVRSDPTRFDVRTATLVTDALTRINDSSSFEVSTPLSDVTPPSAIRLSMNGFSEAYAQLRKTCIVAATIHTGATSSTLARPGRL